MHCGSNPNNFLPTQEQDARHFCVSLETTSASSLHNAQPTTAAIHGLSDCPSIRASCSRILLVPSRAFPCPCQCSDRGCEAVFSTLLLLVPANLTRFCSRWALVTMVYAERPSRCPVCIRSFNSLPCANSSAAIIVTTVSRTDGLVPREGTRAVKRTKAASRLVRVWIVGHDSDLVKIEVSLESFR